MPDFADAHHELGFVLTKLGRTEEAIRWYREAIRLKPTNAMVHYKLRTALAALGRYEEDIEASREATRLDPDNDVGRYAFWQVAPREVASERAVQAA